MSERDQDIPTWPPSTDPHRPRLPTAVGRQTYLHPSTGGMMIRGRGEYWWTCEQKRLEDLAMNGELVLTEGTCYMFLEDEITLGCYMNGLPYRQDIPPGPTFVNRYGNVFMGSYWITREVMIEKGHPDGEVAPYAMVDMVDRWRDNLPGPEQ